MEAIPSLCASTASCGVAAIGSAFSQQASPKQSLPEESLHHQFTFSSPLTLGQPISTTTTPSSQSRAVPRSTSAPVSLLPTPDKKFTAYGGLKEGGILLDKEDDSPSTYARIKAERIEEDSVTKRTSWARRLSTIAPSLDGSLGSPSFNRPSTPSVFSNGSNAPLFSNPPPVTPRNKLVKRSTSQRILHSDSTSPSPFSSRNATFRRPATSYQRSEHLRLQSIQQNLGLSEKASQTSQENLPKSEATDDVSAIASSLTSQRRPFFRYRRKFIGPETGSRRSSFSRILGTSDHISCVVNPSGGGPILVAGSSVQKARMEPSRLSDTALHALDESGSDFDTDLPRGSAARGERKSRNSFSFGDFIPSPSPSTWKKSRGGSLKRKKGRDGVATDRRIVSAPQQSSQGQKNKKYSNKPNHDKGSSSPLPPLEQFSAFEVDLPGTSSSNRTGSMGEEQLLASYQDGPFTSPSPNHGGQTTARVRSSSRRASRVPSDPSTTFGSDNEQSRVFSTDGEEGDFRSETAYDSLRTEASGSSHSGARNHRVDAVFGDQTPPDSLKQNSVAFQEKLARVSLMGYRKPEDFIAEEEGVQTPTHGQDQSETGSSTTVAPLKRQSSPVFASSSSDSTGTRSNDTVNVNGRDAASRGEKNQALKSESMPDIEEDDWDDEFGIESATTAEQSRNHITNPLSTAEALPSDLVALPERPKSNIFEWSERQLPEKGVESGSSLRPRTAHPQQTIERGGRPSGRRPPSGMHLRSQSVPLPPENSKHRFNSSAKLDSWKLGSKGESERWDNDFEFDEPSPIAQDSTNEESTAERVVVPKDILEKQASVHGQFGHVKELTLLVEELRRLHHQGGVHGILNGQSSGLWKEAEGIIDLATLDEDEPLHSANSTSFEFDTFDEDSPTLAGRQRKSSATQSRRESQGQKESSPATQPASFPSPAGSRQGTPKGRPRQDSVARAKNVLETINQFRSPLEPSLEPVEEHVLSSSPSKKMPFDTTSLRDLVTRAGVVTRALKEIIRRIEDPEYVPHTPERRSQSPPDPPFVSQIFYQNSPQPSPSPSNDRKNPSVTERSGGGLAIGSLSGHDNEVHGHSHGHAHMMTVV